MWLILTPETLLSRLSAPEHKALESVATDWAEDNPLRDIVHEVAEEWRGALRRVTPVDSRPDAVPSEILIHILADVRTRAFTRLPGMKRLLDDTRLEEWRRAMTIRDALAKLSYDPPAPEHTPVGTPVNLPLPAVAVPHRHILD